MAEPGTPEHEAELDALEANIKALHERHAAKRREKIEAERAESKARAIAREAAERQRRRNQAKIVAIHESPSVTLGGQARAALLVDGNAPRFEGVEVADDGRKLTLSGTREALTAVAASIDPTSEPARRAKARIEQALGTEPQRERARVASEPAPDAGQFKDLIAKMRKSATA